MKVARECSRSSPTSLPKTSISRSTTYSSPLRGTRLPLPRISPFLWKQISRASSDPYSYLLYSAKCLRRQRYVRLHVTYFATTRRRPDPSFFGLPNTTTLPTTILTTGYTARQSKNRPPPRFQSITWHGETYPGSGEYTVKVFSLTYLKDSIIRSIIGGDEPTWLLRKEWDSYPPLRPISSYAPVEPVKGVQYLAALEPWIST